MSLLGYLWTPIFISQTPFSLWANQQYWCPQRVGCIWGADFRSVLCPGCRIQGCPAFRVQGSGVPYALSADFRSELCPEWRVRRCPRPECNPPQKLPCISLLPGPDLAPPCVGGFASPLQEDWFLSLRFWRSVLTMKRVQESVSSRSHGEQSFPL